MAEYTIPELEGIIAYHSLQADKWQGVAVDSSIGCVLVMSFPDKLMTAPIATWDRNAKELLADIIADLVRYHKQEAHAYRKRLYQLTKAETQ